MNSSIVPRGWTRSIICRDLIEISFSGYSVLVMKHLRRCALIILTILLLVGAGFFRSEIAVDRLKDVYAPLPSRFVSVAGMDIHYRDQGPAGTSPLVLLHGAFSSLHTWEALVEQLGDERRVISVDLPGFGLTGPDPSGDYSMERSVEVLSLFLQRIQAFDSPNAQIHVGGNSLGGQIAWSYAATYPEQTASLLLIGGASGYNEFSSPPPVLFRYVRAVANMDLMALPLTRFTPRFLFRWNLRSAFGDAARITEELVTRYYQLLRREGNRSAVLARLLRSPVHDNSHVISSIRVPALILWGERDHWIPMDHALRFQRDIPDSRLIVLSGVGHVPMEEAPAESAEWIEVFLSETETVTDQVESLTTSSLLSTVSLPSSSGS